MEGAVLIECVLERAERVGRLCRWALGAPGSSRRCQEQLVCTIERIALVCGASRKLLGHGTLMSKISSPSLRALVAALREAEALVGQCALPSRKRRADPSTPVLWLSDAELRDAYESLFRELQICLGDLCPATRGGAPRIQATHIRIVGRLGGGSYGDVMAGDFLGLACAVKRLPMHATGSLQRAIQLEDEAGLHIRLRHPNIVQAFGVTMVHGIIENAYPAGQCDDTRGSMGTQLLPPASSSATEGRAIAAIGSEECMQQSGSLALVLERMETNLWDALRKHIHGWELRDRVAVGLGVAKAVAYLHEEAIPTILHRDLKSPNVLLARDGTPRLSDFGSAVATNKSPEGRGWRRGKGSRGRRSGPRGTPAWQAPEVLAGGSYTDRADVFSLGVVLWELVTQRDPCDAWGSNETVVAAVTSGDRLPLPLGDSPATIALRDIISACWHQNSLQRPSSPQVVSSLEALLGSSTIWPDFPTSKSAYAMGDRGGAGSKCHRSLGTVISAAAAVAAAAAAAATAATRVVHQT